MLLIIVGQVEDMLNRWGNIVPGPLDFRMWPVFMYSVQSAGVGFAYEVLL